MNHSIKCKMQTHTTSRIKHTNTVHDLGFEKQFLDTATKAQSISGKTLYIYIYKDFVNIENNYCVQDTINRTKRLRRNNCKSHF